MRTTKSLSIALERAAEILPKGKVEAPGHGRRKLTFKRPGVREHWTVEGTIARCLYVAIFAAVTKEELGGLGMELSEVRDALRLRPEGVPSKGLGAHEEKLFEDVALGDGR